MIGQGVPALIRLPIGRVLPGAVILIVFAFA